MNFFSNVLQIFANNYFWRARFRLYQNEIVQENMRLTAFFKLYKMCTLLHRSKLNSLATTRFENSPVVGISDLAGYWCRLSVFPSRMRIIQC